MKVSEKWGVDVETAVKLALEELKLSKEEVDIEVLEEATGGFLGIGSKLARVRVTAKEEKDEEKASFDEIDKVLADLPENKIKKVPQNIFAEEDYEKEEKSYHYKKRKLSEAEQIKRDEEENSLIEDVINRETLEKHIAKDFLESITREMNIDVDFFVKENEKIIYVEAKGKDVGSIIGKRGQTLDALQYITGLAVNRQQEGYKRVIIDAENYREKRDKTLISLAQRLALKVEKTKRSVKLEPMNPYERKIIHKTLQKHAGVHTRSEGEDPYRRVIIEKN